MAVTTRLWSARRLLLTMSSQSASTFANQVVAFVILWLIVVTQALGELFDRPGMVARDALVPRVARQDDVPLVRATTLQETLQNTALFVGPLAAGLLIAAVAEQGTLLVAAVMFAAAMLLIPGLERQRPVHDQPLTPARALADVREGFRFIVHEPLLGPDVAAGRLDGRLRSAPSAPGCRGSGGSSSPRWWPRPC
jgi:hypothetical protein